MVGVGTDARNAQQREKFIQVCAFALGEQGFPVLPWPWWSLLMAINRPSGAWPKLAVCPPLIW
jgi:hypothetical protein